MLLLNGGRASLLGGTYKCQLLAETIHVTMGRYKHQMRGIGGGSCASATPYVFVFARVLYHSFNGFLVWVSVLTQLSWLALILIQR